MKILYINTFTDKGGAAKFFQQLRHWMSTHHVETWQAVRHASSTSDTTVIVRRNIFSIFISKILRTEFLFMGIFRQIQAHRNWASTDIVHIHNAHGRFLSLGDIYKLCTHKKCIWTLHDPHILSRKDILVPQYAPIFKNNNPLFNLLLRKIIIATKPLLITPSQWLKNTVQKEYPHNQIAVIKNGIDVTVFKPHNKNDARKKLSLPLDATIILFVANGGTANVQKGGVFLQTIKDRNPQYTYIELGRDVYITDDTQMSLYYAAADTLLFPSLAENMPLSILESMACGTPVVAFDTGGVSEIIDHKVNGYVASYKDCEDLERGLHFVLQSPANMHRSAREKILTQFNCDSIFRQYQDIYQTIIRNEN